LSHASPKKQVSRRDAIRAGAASLASAAYVSSSLAQSRRSSRDNGRNRDGTTRSRRTTRNGRDAAMGTPITFEKFTQDLTLPAVAQPVSIGTPPPSWGGVGNCDHGVAPEFFDRTCAEDTSLNWAQLHPDCFYELVVKRSTSEVIPGITTPIIGYGGTWPGTTFRSRICEPMCVRVKNETEDVELSNHLHGGHNPAHSDGYPNFYVLPGCSRDYFYTNTVPMHKGVPDFSEAPSTMWYHDHGMDITAHTVLEGLAGFFLTYDELELGLINDNVLPGDPYDIPIAIQDRRFNSDGTIWFDPLDHNGTIGDVYVLNGKAFPKLHVERRKYRFRFLDGCNARHLELRLSTGEPFLAIGRDSWLYPEAIYLDTILMSPAKRSDVIIDFTNAPSEVYLENILEQDSGRGPAGDLDRRGTQIPGVPMMKFIVEGAPGDSPRNDATIKVGDALRPHVPILEEEIVHTRVFEFHRSKGAWQINGEFFDEWKSNACPKVGTAERWILKNGGGGWWHPIHIHIESHQIKSVDGHLPYEADRHKVDTCMLGPNTEAEIFMNFRTFKGPFVFHCHNLEHEDMRMMFVVDPCVDGPKTDQPISHYFP
jgi:FtsP/CotA-like multicopper oxidase with cupredoxin domain